MNDITRTSKDVTIGCYVMEGVTYTSHEDGSETSRKATAEEVLLAGALLSTTDELRGCSRELAIERRAAQRTAGEPRACLCDESFALLGRMRDEHIEFGSLSGRLQRQAEDHRQKLASRAAQPPGALVQAAEHVRDTAHEVPGHANTLAVSREIIGRLALELSRLGITKGDGQ